MTDEAPDHDDEPTTSYEDAAAIGYKVAEMADRVWPMNSLVPGSQAVWWFEIDDRRFKVVVTVDDRPPGEDHVP